jgi:hypothetical protein
MQYSEYYTSAAAIPGLVVYFILGVQSSKLPLFWVFSWKVNSHNSATSPF